MSEWEPATDAEVEMRDALRTDDQESYFRILAGVDLLLPVSADALAGLAPLGWGTWSTGGRTHVLAFTSQTALQACLSDYTGSFRRVPYAELASTWPNLEWWLAVNPGLPIEGYLPAWFVAQLARGDLRLPTRGPAREPGPSRIQEIGAAARSATRGPEGSGQGGPTYDPPAAPAAAGPGPRPFDTPPAGRAPAADPAALPVRSSGAGTPVPAAYQSPAVPPFGGAAEQAGSPSAYPGGQAARFGGPDPLPNRPGSSAGPGALPNRPGSSAGPGALPNRPGSSAGPNALPNRPGSSAGPDPLAARPGSPAPGANPVGSGMATPGWDSAKLPFGPENDPRGPLQDLKGPLPVRTPMANTPPIPEHVKPYDPAEAALDPRWAAPGGAIEGGRSGEPAAAGQLPRREPGGSGQSGPGGAPGGSGFGGLPTRPTTADSGSGGLPGRPGTADSGFGALPRRSGASSEPGPAGLPSRPGASASSESGFGGSADRPGSPATSFPQGPASPQAAGQREPGAPSPTLGGALPRRQVTPPSERPASMAAAAQALGAPIPPPAPPNDSGPDQSGPSAPTSGPGRFGPPGPADRYAPPGSDRFGPSGPAPALEPRGGVAPARPDEESAATKPLVIPPVIPGPPGSDWVPNRSTAPAPPSYGTPSPVSPVAPGYGTRGPASVTPEVSPVSAAPGTPVSAASGVSSFPAGPGAPISAPPVSAPGAQIPAAPVSAPGTPVSAAPASPATFASSDTPVSAAPGAPSATDRPGSAPPAYGSDASGYGTGSGTSGYGAGPDAPDHSAGPDASGYGSSSAAHPASDGSGLGVAGSATGSRQTGPGVAGPAPTGGFVPANDVERELQDAADHGNTDVFLSTLLLATVLVPVANHSRPGSAPGESGFAFRTEQVGDERFLIVFTSKDRLAEHFAEPTRTVGVRFYELIRNWPDPAWSFAVNPGTPVGAKYPGTQIIALANWATEAGLGAEPADSPIADDPTGPVIPAPEPASDEAQHATVMQKTVSAEQVDYYLDRGYDRVAGFVHRASEVEHLRTPAELFGALGLYYASSPFQPDAKEAFVLRWPAYRPSLYRIPYGGQNEQALRAMDGWVIERPPFRGNGFAPGEGRDVIAEFKVDSVRLPHGAQLWRVDSDGNERMIAIFDADGPLWRRVGEH